MCQSMNCKYTRYATINNSIVLTGVFGFIFFRIISEARSYGETLVHPQTKTLVPSSQQYRSQNTSLYDKPLSTILMDDAMAERDLGSTFLLPHTHLYKPVDRVKI